MTRLLLLVLLVPATFVLLAWTRPHPDEAARLDRDEEPAELIFSHQYHLEEEELECSDCHGAVEESSSGLDNLLPAMEVCGDCHDVEEPDACGTCHSDVDNARIVPRVDAYSQPFSHERHLGSDLTCERCHADVMQKTTVEPLILPTMVACMDCHEDRGASQECAVCHLPGERLTPLSHTPAFAHAHSDLARQAAVTMDADKTCQTCHDDNFCQDCHEGDNLDRFTHPLNFAFTHALEAQANETTCATCHTDTQFCIDCHRDNQVLPHTHTAGWTNRADGGRHRLEALSDLESCIACHEADADRVCQPCHGGFN
jgi:hypothetical protein